MDDRRFDSLVKALAEGKSRRSVLKGLLGLGGAAVIGSVALDGDTDAAVRPTPTPTPVKCPGKQVVVGGKCACPASAPNKCGPDCCTGKAGDPPSPTHTECCDNACCNGTCTKEEGCCRTNPRAGGLPPTNKICATTSGTRCCGYEQECCSVDGCCDTVCAGGSDGRSFCCARANFCPGGSESADLCCAGGAICCGSGTNGNACFQGNCCADSDCSDGNACTTNSCRDHVCVSAPVDCNDGNLCTTDSCDPQRGCIHTPVNCNDNNACTVDTCDPQRGCVFTPIDCTDGDLCTIDTCDPSRGCVHTPVDCSEYDAPTLCLEGYCFSGECLRRSTCAEGTNCCGNGTCSASCVACTPDTCNDGNLCTTDTCDPRLGCIYTPVDCSEYDDPSLCLEGYCFSGECLRRSVCAEGTQCCEDGTCRRVCGCLNTGSGCEASSECCEGCCIADLPTRNDWIQVCTEAGLTGDDAILCARMILELGYPGACLFPTQITIPAFPNNPVTLPCVD